MMAALVTSERGRGARELRKASNDKNRTQHHNQANARVSESSGVDEKACGILVCSKRKWVI